MEYPLLPEIPIAVSRDIFLTLLSFSFSSLHCKDSAANKSPARSLTQQKDRQHFSETIMPEKPCHKAWGHPEGSTGPGIISMTGLPAFPFLLQPLVLLLRSTTASGKSSADQKAVSAKSSCPHYLTAKRHQHPPLMFPALSFWRMSQWYCQFCIFYVPYLGMLQLSTFIFTTRNGKIITPKHALEIQNAGARHCQLHWHQLFW